MQYVARSVREIVRTFKKRKHVGKTSWSSGETDSRSSREIAMNIRILALCGLLCLANTAGIAAQSALILDFGHAACIAAGAFELHHWTE